MITANKIIYNLKNIASSGPASDDFRISDRQLLHWYNDVRSMLISQAIKNKQDLTDEWIQTIPCIELEQIDKSLCCDIETECYVLRSTLPIPPTVETDYNNTIISVNGLDGIPLSKINQFRANTIKYNKFTKNRLGWYIKNYYLYVLNSDELSKVSLTGIFEDPTELESFFCDSVSCFNFNDRYPVSAKMDNMITDIVIKTKILPLLNIPQDLVNDSSNLTPPQQQGK